MKKIFELLERGEKVNLDYNQWEEFKRQLCQVSGTAWSKWEWLVDEYTCLSIDPIYEDDAKVYWIQICDSCWGIYDYYTDGEVIFEIDWYLREWELPKKLGLTYLFTSFDWENDKIVQLYYDPPVDQIKGNPCPK